MSDIATEDKPLGFGGVYSANAAPGAAPAPSPPSGKDDPMGMDDYSSEESSNDNLHIDFSAGNGTSGKIPFKKIFPLRKKSSERTRDKKLRQNRQLRKSLLPKNALMALNELKGVHISDFSIDSNSEGGFTAIVTVNLKSYEGKGLSKTAAKNGACEKALRDFIISKMKPRGNRRKEDAASEEAMDTKEEEEEAPEDDLPMLNLASFAIYKLFAEWERDGYTVPELHPQSQSTQPAAGDPAPTAPVDPKEPKKAPIRTQLPPNWETMHPATLLCIMRPGISFVDFGLEASKPNSPQVMGVVVDNQEFTASGRSKKIARRNVGVNACNTLFGTNFAYEEH